MTEDESMPKAQLSDTQIIVRSTPSPGPSTGSSKSTVNKFNMRRTESPPVIDEYGDYKSDSQLFFSDLLYHTRKWSLKTALIFMILTCSNITYSAQKKTFIEASLHLRCFIPSLAKTNWTYEEKEQISSVSNKQCYYYDYDYSMLSKLLFDDAWKVVQKIGKPEVKKCISFIWKINDRGYTYIDEFGLQCSTFKFDYTYIGLMFGYVIGGLSADIYGRKLVIIAAELILVLSCFLIAIAPTVEFVYAGTILFGIGGGTVATITHILILETVHYKVRIYAAPTLRLGFSLGHFCQAGVYHYVQHWRYYQWAVNCTLLIPLLTQWLLPESPHWLLCCKNWHKMQDVLRELSYPDLVRNTDDYSNKHVEPVTLRKILRLLCKPIFRRKLTLNACLHGLLYFLYIREHKRILHVINMEFIFFFILGLSVIISTVVVPVMLKRMGRPMCISSCLLLLALFYCSFTIYHQYGGVANVIACICLTTAQTVIVVNRLLIVEMFPTRARATAMGICRFLGVFTITICNLIEKSAHIVEEVESYGWTINTFLMLAAAFICIFITNTGDVPLPDTELQAIVHF